MNEEPLFFSLIFGLGNPGKEYSGTRHNIGFDVLDLWADREGLTWKSCSYAKAKSCKTSQGIWLIKPQSYMNNSGREIKACLNWFKVQPDQIIVLVDDIHLPVGQLRLRSKGSPGGHNGLKSIEAHLGTKDYPRLRAGVGEVENNQTERPEALRNFVLGAFSKEEKEQIEKMKEGAIEALRWCLTLGLEKAMSRTNQKI